MHVHLDPAPSHSFGYECHKRSNLIALDRDVVAFAAGNFIQVVNLATMEHTYIRSLSGGGIGAIAVSCKTHKHACICTYVRMLASYMHFMQTL